MTTIQALWHAYVTDGSAFAIAHLVCLGVVLWRLGGVYLEARRLARWDPDIPAPPGDENSLVGLFDEFAASVRQLGPKGGNVDVGEHLARIQDDVARRETHLSDATHWFLLIGIGGTLFGLFEFALRVQGLRGAEVVQTVGTALASAMAKAFPVGFAGLALLILFQAIASVFEGRLNSAVAGAMSRALRFRRQLTVAETDFIETVRISISDAMAPLRDLGGVLDNSLKPVILAFQDRLDQALGIVQTQMEEVKNESARIRSLEREFASAAIEVRKTTEALASFSDSISGRLNALNEQSAALQQQSQATIKWSSELIRLSNRQQEKLESLAKTFEVDLEHAVTLTDKVYDVVDQVANVTTEVRKLPEMLADMARTAIPALVDSAGGRLLEQWKQNVREMTVDLGRSAAIAMSELMQTVEESTEILSAAVAEWRKVNVNVESLVKDAIGQAMKSALVPSVDLASEVKKAIGARMSTVQALESAIDSLRGVFETAQEEVVSFSAGLQQASDSIEKAADKFVLAASPTRSVESSTP